MYFQPLRFSRTNQIDLNMKTRFIFSALFLFVFSISTFAGDKHIYSYGPDGKNEFVRSNDRILIRFADGLSFADKAAILSAEKGLEALSKEDVLPAPDVTIAKVSGLNLDQLDEVLKRLNANPLVTYANPFVIYKDGTYQGIQDRVIVRLKSDKDINTLNRIAKDLKLNVLERNEFDPLVFVLQTTKQTSGNAIDVANRLHESSAFEYAEPDFLLLLKRFNTNDGLLDYQWSLNNTGSSLQYNGTAGADMNVFPAWATTTGSASIKVAVVDEGVDLNHPDLQANLLSGYDATGQGSGGGPSGDDAHGTACAGIIAAAGNNNLGVAGVAYSAKIIPVRIAYSSGTSWVTSNTWIGNALNWAWQTAGADVLSNSWGGGSSSSTINNAITGAVTNGRGGLGAPVLFAAGNDNGANSYPATQTNTISVIAMSMCYQRKNPSSCDGENWWGSNYGAGADVAAPGVKIATTDISGSAGYATGDYTGTFNGTSSATPNAAGVMALILSANPNLTQTQARFALESTCRKVGSYTYNSSVSGQPNGTWSNDLGYGLVDAYAAVLSVSPQVSDDAGISSISSPNGTICATSASPSITLNNYGSNTLSSVTINYQLDAGSVNTYNWSGSLSSASSTTVNLPSVTFSGGSHTFNAWTSNPNGTSDNGPSNDDASSNFVSASNGVTLSITFDNYPEETSWQILDGSTVLAAGGTYASQPDGSTLVTNICLPDGCFDFVISDAYGDGICCSYGNGSYILTADVGGATLASGGTFTSSQTTNFCVTSSNPLVASISGSSNVSCNGGNNGSASATASGGVTPYSYSWSNGGSGSSISGLTAGTYTVTVTDGNNDQAQANVTISQPSVLSASASAIDVSCFGGNNGSASVSASGGTAPYSYSWSNGGSTATINGLAAGSYSVTVTDANGCTANSAASVSQPTLLTSSASSTAASCNGASDGAVDLSVSGGTAPYSYNWSNGASTQDLSNVPAGAYSVVLYDANGCSDLALASVGEPGAILLSTTSSDASCGSANNGTVDLSVSGGNTPYSYSWSNGAITEDLGAVAAGNYSVVVTDASGCSASTNATVGENSTLSASASSSFVSCNGGSDGSASGSASGGTAPYSYSWSNGGSGTSISGLSAGSYTLTVTDVNGCTATANAIVGQPTMLSVNTGSTDATCETADGSATASVSGGTAPYSYSWSNGSSSSTAAGLAAGSYSVTVTDVNGCTAASGVTVGEDCGGCTYVSIDNNNFEGGWGIWNDGGGDVAIVSNATYANSGSYTIELRDNSGLFSATTTSNLDLSSFSELTIAFSYYPTSMETGEDFWLQVSTNGGASFTTIGDWNAGIEFVNNQRYNESVVYAGTFTSNTQIRFQCDASGNSDWVYIDDVVITGCQGGPVLPTCTDGIQNGDEEGVDCGGSSCSPCATCSDGIQNGDEEGIDCGGSACAACPTCSDGIQNGDEEDVDCGGSSCSPCPTCSDGIQNGDEEGVDCGGTSCQACATGCSYVNINSSNFESGWGIWNDGGTDCSRSSNGTFAYSGTYSIMIRDNSGVGSSTTTNALDLTTYDEVTVDFVFRANGMENGEDFWLQYATGTSYTTVAAYAAGTSFVNGNFYAGSVVIPGPFSAGTTFRFRCDASANDDQIYLDDVVISGCKNNSSARLADPTAIESGTKESLISNVNLYPNPTSETLNINLELMADANIQLRVMDMSGKLVFDRNITTTEGSNKITIQSSDLPAGVYVMSIVADTEMITKRFVVQH
ncbi:MAG: hypothetical protein RL266_1967 [Bacteroidota bacterium]